MNVEKENMWRSLQELKPIQSWRCRLGWHRWTTYEVIERNEWGAWHARCICADCGMPRIEQPYSKSFKRDN